MMLGFVLAQMSIAVLDLIMKAAAAMPLLTALGLVFGRRGNGIFCLWGCSRLGVLSIVLSFAGPVCILANYILQMTALNAHDFFCPFFYQASNELFTYAFDLADGYGLPVFWGKEPEQCFARCILKTN